mgnify:CR=1 FL=1
MLFRSSVTEELCRFANESAFEEVLHPVKGGGKDMRYAKGDDRIIKPAWNATKEENDNILRRRIISRLRRIKSIKAKNDEDMFSSKALMESGRINMILWYMDEYSCYDLEEILSNKKVVNEVEKRYGKFFSIPRYVLKYQEVFNERT